MRFQFDILPLPRVPVLVHSRSTIEIDETTRITCNDNFDTKWKVRLNIDRHGERWCVKHEKKGQHIGMISFPTRTYTEHQAKELLSIAQQEVEKIGVLPSREAVIALYEVAKQRLSTVDNRNDSFNRVNSF